MSEVRAAIMRMIRDMPEEALPELVHFLQDLARAYDRSKPPKQGP